MVTPLSLALAICLAYVPSARSSLSIDVTKDLHIPAELKSVVEPLARQANELFSSSDAPVALDYSIFDGESILRKHALLHAEKIPKAILSLQFLLQKKVDAAHEVVLGLDMSNLEDAEFAATHRGQTNWTQDHPFSDEDDIVHSMIHRLEGDLEGEGGHAGWNNAKFWIAGGPKRLAQLGQHAVHKALCNLCPTIAPSLVDLLVCKKPRYHEIIAGGGKLRNVLVDKECFDPISFINLCQHIEWSEELRNLQIAEVLLLIRLELLTLYGEADESLVDFWMEGSFNEQHCGMNR